MTKACKKTIIVSLCLVMLFGVIGFGISTVSAASVDDLTYEIVNETVTITDCNESASGKLVIPDTIEGYPVTSIGEKAFEGCAGLTSVIVPDSVISISQGAFKDCNNLKEMTLPFVGASRKATDHDAVFGYLFEQRIDGYTSFMVHSSSTAFNDQKYGVQPDGSTWQYSCSDVYYYDLNYWTVSYYYFIPSSIKKVTITDADNIGTAAFMNCNNIDEIIINDTVESIGGFSFKNCTGISDITIPNSVTSIGGSAFSNCTGLTSVTIPDSVTFIVDKAFECCPLEYVKMGNGLTSIPSTLINKDSLKTFVVGENVDIVEGFQNCKNLNSITMLFGPTKIDDIAFYGCAGLASITIPDSVTSIGERAFEGCTGIASIVIPGSVNSIGKSTFSNCTGLKSITISNSVTDIGEYAFEGCTEINSVKYTGTVADWCKISFENGYSNPIFYAHALSINNDTLTEILSSDLEGVSFIGDYAFYGCAGLTGITIPDSVITVGTDAFLNCPFEYVKMGNGLTYIPSSLINKYSLKTFIIGSGIKAIDSLTFKDCISLTSITIPNSVTDIGEYAFQGCTALQSVDYIGTVADWCLVSFGNGYSNPAYYSHTLSINNDILTKILSSDLEGVSCIGNYAFAYCADLSSVTIPDCVTNIGNYAFEFCTNLTSVTIPGSVTIIGNGAFSGCIGLNNITIPGSVTNIGNGAFSGCSALKTAGSIGNGFDYEFGWTNTIPANAFSGCTGLTSVTIPNSITSISAGMFSGCTNLANVSIPNSITEIEDNAFKDCVCLTEIVIPDSVINVGTDAFKNCPLEYVKMGNGLTSIPSTLIKKETLKTFIVGSGIENIEAQTFKDCKKLTNIIISDGVTSIGQRAFWRCTALSKIKMPASVVSIGSGAFLACGGLIKTAGPTGGGYDYEFGWTELIPDYAFNELSGLISITIPDSVTDIGEYAFSNCSQLTSITLPNSITGISDGSFWGCDGLTSITIPGKVTSIGEDAFRACTNLECITIPDSVASIGYSAFRDCTRLSDIIIPNNVTNIGYSMFSGCSSLTSITIPDSVTGIADNAFDNCPLEYVKMGSGLTSIPSTLIKQDSLKTFIVGSNVTCIEGNSFRNCTGLTEFVVPHSVTTIGEYAFYDCTGLVNIKIPSSVTVIGNYAFNHVNNIEYYGSADGSPWGAKTRNGYVDGTSVYTSPERNTLVGCSSTVKGSIIIPDSVTTIEPYAFYNCADIEDVYVPLSVNKIGADVLSGCTSLTDVYYEGSYDDRYKIDINNVNAKLLDAEWHYNSEASDIPSTVVYTLSYNANGGSGAPESQNGNGIIQLSGIRPSRDGYTFLGWSENRTATSAQYQPGNTYSLDKDTELFAVWKKNNTPPTNYTLTYNANGGSGAPGNQTGSGYVTISNTKPTRSGYTFLGWATSKSATSAQYGAGSLINLDKNITLYAVWQKGNTPDNPDNPSTDIPEANVIKGNSADNKKTYDYRTTVTFTANVPKGGSVQWYVDGKPAGTENTLTVKDMKTDYTVKVVVTDKNGNKTMDEEQVTIKHGFFDILIWFFVHLFNPSAYDVKQ